MKKKTGIISTVVIGLAALFFATHTQKSEEEIAGSPAESVPTLGTSQPMESKPLVESTRSENLKQDVAEVSPLSSFKGAEALPQTEQASLWTAFSAARRKIRPLTDHQKTMPENEDALYLASSPSQKIRARFLDDGVRLLSGYPGREWNAVMSLDTEGDVLEVRQQGTQIEYVRDGIVEWFLNKPEGLEHGFIVERPTTEYTEYTEGKLKIPVQVDGLSVQTLENNELQFVNEAGELVLSYDKLKVWDANGIELTSVMEPTSRGLNILVADAGATYPITIDPLIASLEAKLGPEVTGSGSEYDEFGWSVSVSGDTALIGNPKDDITISRGEGSVYVFIRNGLSWSEQTKLTAGDGEKDDYFGHALSLDGDTALIGAYGDGDVGAPVGSAYVFVRSGTNWNEQAKLTDDVVGNQFGYSVSLSGNTALVGAYGNNSTGGDPGSAYVFVRSGTSWNEQATLTASDAGDADNFGKSVSLDGDTAIIGAPKDDAPGYNEGSAYVFVRTGTVWNEQDKLTASDAVGGDQFGWSVSVSGDSALVGTIYDHNDGVETGAAYVFVRNGANWSEQAKLLASDGASHDEFGVSVSLDGDTALIGSRDNDDAGADSGSAYVFVRNAGVWSEEAKLTAGDATNSAYFGYSVSLDGDTALVGAYGDFNSAARSGSAYVFTRSGSNWSEQEKLTAGDAAFADYFGYRVSLSGDTALVGAYKDNDAGIDSGSAYVFVRNDTVWSEQAKLTASDAAAEDRFGNSVSVDGDTVVIGAYYKDDGYTRSGCAYVFVRNGTSWSQQAKLSAGTGSSYFNMGDSVSISGNTALVGAEGAKHNGVYSGIVYVFVRSGTSWSRETKLTASDAADGDWFGTSVSLDGDTALVGAPHNADAGENSGSAYVFFRSGTNWNEQAKITASDAAADDWFGFSVSISGDTALVGAWGDDYLGSRTGSAYVYIRNTGVWSEQRKLTAFDAASGDDFGRSVSLDGETALIGAYGDDDIGSASGSAYMFVRVGTNWNHNAKLTAPGGTADDRFGFSVSLDGDTALVGTHYPDGTDVYGDIVFSQGTAYIFRLPAPAVPGEIGVTAMSGILLDGGINDFGNQAVGVGKVLTFTISNDAVGSLTHLLGMSLSKDGVDASAFTLGDLSSSCLTNGVSTIFRITYIPQSVGSHTAAVHIVSNDLDESPFDITLIGTGLANADSDPGSDAWETANGFSPTTDGDVMTLDSDGDGTADIMEIYQGTERYPVGAAPLAMMVLSASEEGNGFSEVYTSNGVLKVQYRRSTTQAAVNGQGIWIPDLQENNWLYSGESTSGTVVTVTENVVSNGAGFEIVESSAEVTSGDTESLFFSLELTPNE